MPNEIEGSDAEDEFLSDHFGRFCVNHFQIQCGFDVPQVKLNVPSFPSGIVLRDLSVTFPSLAARRPRQAGFLKCSCCLVEEKSRRAVFSSCSTASKPTKNRFRLDLCVGLLEVWILLLKREQFVARCYSTAIIIGGGLYVPGGNTTLYSPFRYRSEAILYCS